MGDIAVGWILGIVAGFGAERLLRNTSRTARVLTPTLVFPVAVAISVLLLQAGLIGGELSAGTAGFGFLFAVGFTWAWARANAEGTERRREPSETVPPPR